MARRNVRALWAAKLAGHSTGPQRPPPVLGSAARPAFAGTVLGIDPSLRGTGLAVLHFLPRQAPALLYAETVRPARTADLPTCLAAIFRAVEAAAVRFSATHAALEQTIYVQNFQTAQILGAARGAALAAVAVRGLTIAEYPPLRIKQAVTGFGRASKEQMQRQVAALLLHGAVLPSDQADAAAAALCHSFTWRPE